MLTKNGWRTYLWLALMLTQDKAIVSLRDDDAERGDAMRLVLTQRKAASAYSHDLAGQGETDAASFGLCGEERNEDVGGYVVGDKTGVVAYVDDDGFLLVGVSVEADEWFGGRDGLQVIESLYGIFQKICHYV